MGMRKVINRALGGVNSFMGRGGSVELTTGDLGSVGGLIVKKTSHTFTREYAWGEIAEIGDIPANAVVYGLWSPVMPSGPFNMVCSVGTSSDHEVFGLGGSYYPSNGFSKMNYWHKESDASKLVLLFNDPFTGDTMTSGLTGKTVEFFIEYIQE